MSKLIAPRGRWIGLLVLLLALAFLTTPSFQAAETSRAAGDGLRQPDPRLESQQIADSTAKPKPLRILVIGAHPADVFDQSGGTMAHHVKRGDWVGCAVLTTGVRVHDKVIVNEMHDRKEIPAADELKKTMALRAKVKEKEVIRACSIVGVREQDVHFLGADDGILLVNDDNIRQVASLIRRLRPNIILTHFPYEDGGLASGHATTGQIVVNAIAFAGAVDPGDQTPPHKVTQVFFFGQGGAPQPIDLWGARGGFYSDIFVDITDVVEKKVECLDSMDSQGYGGAYARKRIETTDGSCGTRIGVAYAESFISLYSTTHYYLPVSQIDLEHSTSSDRQSIQRKSFRVQVP